MKIKIAGRYFRPELAGLFTALHNSGKKSKVRTATERLRAFIRYSLDNDFREGFRARAHGQDAYQITEREYEKLLPVMKAEQVEQEAEYLREAIEAAREYIQKAESRLASLTADRGSVVLLRRQAEIRNAQAKAERKAV